MKVLDLFSGIGGFSLGLESTGCFETVAFCEKEEFCRKVLRKHWPDIPIWEDIHNVSGLQFRGIDLICGGFPCQPVSLAGKRRGSKDDRWLWPEFFRVIREAQPTWCLVENVPGLRTKHADEVLADLEGQGYACWPLVVGAVHAGAPHRRQRVWIIAYSERTMRGAFNSPCNRLEGEYSVPQRAQGPGRFGIVGENRDAPDTQRNRLQGGKHQESGQGVPGESRRLTNTDKAFDWSQAPESVLRGVDDGVPCGVDRTKRLKALGNAVVPQVVAQIGCQIAWSHMLDD